VLTIFIPGWVELDQIQKITKLIAQLDQNIPFTILAFFGAYKLSKTRSPSLSEMCDTCLAIKDLGLQHVRLGNLSVFADTAPKQKELILRIGKEALG
jgi:pyruvate-formate lyase-activating enzyme